MSTVTFALSMIITYVLLISLTFTWVDKIFYPQDKITITALLIKNAKQAIKTLFIFFLVAIAAFCVFSAVYFSLNYFINK
ncbi:hypothetical protein CEQ28_000855 [Hafnia alvei]|nr:hypothetical protein CEQ28_000855 [Hafnia alvei]